MKSYILFYQEEKTFKCVINDETTIKIFDKLPKYEYNCFYLQKGYDKTDEGLLLYQQDFILSVEQLKEIKNRKDEPINYIKYFTHQDAVLLIFFSLIGTKTIIDRSDNDFESVDITEAKWFKRCNNGGLVYFDKTKIGLQQSYGYDYKSFYPTLLNKFIKIPKKRGVETTINELPINDKGKIKFGIYKAEVICNDDNFLKLFSFSTTNFYTHYSLETALKYEKLNMFGVKINLIQQKNNAYIYNEEDLISGCSYFGHWYDSLINLKKKYPKNILVKHLLSSLWGHISEYNKVYGDEDVKVYKVK